MPGALRGHGLELAADPFGRVGLQIEHVLRGGPAQEVEENNAVRFSRPDTAAALKRKQSLLMEKTAED